MLVKEYQAKTPILVLCPGQDKIQDKILLCKYDKRKLQLTNYQLTAILRSCLGRATFMIFHETSILQIC